MAVLAPRFGQIFGNCKVAVAEGVGKVVSTARASDGGIYDGIFYKLFIFPIKNQYVND